MLLSYTSSIVCVTLFFDIKRLNVITVKLTNILILIYLTLKQVIINMDAIKDLQATGLKYMNSLKIIPLNPYTFIVALTLISAALIGAYAVDKQNEDKVIIPGLSQQANTDPITEAATATDKDIHNLETALPTMKLGKFRATTQDIQQRITNQWFDAGRASGMTEDEAARNGLYIRYLSAASKVVTQIQNKETVDTTTYKMLYKELTGKESLVNL